MKSLVGRSPWPGFAVLVTLTMATPILGQAQKFEVSALEKGVLDLTNAERAKMNLPPLKPNAKLFYAARFHSKNMAVTKQFSHILDDKNPIDRAKAYGYPVPYVGENIALAAQTPAQAITIWMNSQGHRENILKPQYTEIGIGIYRSGNGPLNWTQVFGASKEADNPPDLTVGTTQFPEPPTKTPDKPKPMPMPEPVSPFKPVEPKQPPFEVQEKLSKSDNADPLLKDRPSKIFLVKLEANKKYLIDLQSTEFDAYLFLKDNAGKIISHDDDGGGGKNARISFQPTASATFRVVITSLKAGESGAFGLQVKQE